MRFLLVLSLSAAALAADGVTTYIKVDQAGYRTDAPKVAMVAAKSPAADFTVRDAATGKVMFSGKLGPAVNEPDSGDRPQVADFTKLTRSGSYFIEVPGVGRSWKFSIAPDVYARPFYLAMRAFYGQRCGTAVDLGPEFPGYSYPPCHLKGGWHESSGKTGPRESTKGWHDAGDYGRYVVNSGITTGTLLWAWELFGDRIKNVNLNIPESNNSTPDFLDEIRWNLEWMLTMQDTDGGVWQKQTTEKFSGFVMPDKDDQPSLVIGAGKPPYKSSCATADFASVMAIAGRVYKPYDADFAGKALGAARKAWAWVEQNPNVLFNNPPGVNTGAYGDSDCSDERLWAAAELWRTTREGGFEKYFLANYAPFSKELGEAGAPGEGWAHVGSMGLWTYVLGGGKDAGAVAAITKDSLTAADSIVARAKAHGYHIAMRTQDYVWGSNGVAANYAMQLMVTNAIRRNPAYVNTALDNLHYLLGRNTFSLSWVTRVGENPYRHPHHRPSGADNNAEPWPGMLSGGPNKNRQDQMLQALPKDTPPARVYVDDQASYGSNEMAINWNAPLVFVLAGALPGK